MDKREAKSLLSVYRKGEAALDPRFAEAEKLAASDPELADWWQGEEKVDRAIAAKFAAVPVPAELRAQLLARQTSTPLPIPRSWPRAALLMAASIVAAAVLFSSWRGPFRPAASLADYRNEMVSFVKLTPPPLELETHDLTRIDQYLANAGAPAQIEIPQALRNMNPVGCRVLRFRGHNVALICFKRDDGRLLHLLVMTNNAFRGLPEKSQPSYAAEGKWMTAAWREGDMAYLLAGEGDERKLREYLQSS